MGQQKFIVCGASRSGKSVLSRRLQAKYTISWILGDAMVSSMEDAFPQLEIAHHGHLHDIGGKFADYIRYVLWHYSYAECGYVFDAMHLYPRHIPYIREKIGNVPAIFLGYVEADPELKLAQIRQFDPTQNWWTSELSDTELRKLVHSQIAKSIELREECAKFNMPYIEMSREFEASLESAEKVLNREAD